MIGIHGGDIYRNQVEMDFSVNVNPLGIPETVKRAVHEAADQCGRYPDIGAEKLREAVSAALAVPKEYLLFGNGSSELFMASVHGIKPKKTVIPVPSFYGYEYAAKAGEGEVVYYRTGQEDGFCLTEDFYKALNEDVELLFLANPNNPTGKLLDGDLLRGILKHCMEQGIYVVLDECFIEFCRGQLSLPCHSLLTEIEEYGNLLLVRAFTKIFSIPGVRLGYLISSNKALLDRIGRQLPEWNLSCFAQAAGYACAGQRQWIVKTADYIRRERQFLEEGLRQRGMQVFPSAANFILVYSEEPLYERLLARGILIRDCRNFRGLKEGYYRIAVRSREENVSLLRAMEETKSLPRKAGACKMNEGENE